jgi:ABC transporter substrate binding protein
MQSLGAKVSACILLVGRSGMVPPRCFYVAAILLMASVLSARAADEIQVYNAEIAKVGQWTFQLHNNYAFIGRKEPDFPGGLVPNHALQGTGEWAYEIERVIEALGHAPNGGLICTGDAFTDSPPIRALIISLTAVHRVPALHSQREFVMNGGLLSYGNDQTDQFRLAATYVDRILKGQSPADLPIQQPTKYELVINLKTAKALGLEIPPTLLARADEVIE